MGTPHRAMRPVSQRRQATPHLAGQPRVNGLARHPEPVRDLDHGLAVMNNQRHRLIPLLHHT